MKKTTLSLMLALAMIFAMLTVTSCASSPLDGNDAVAAMKYVDEQMEGVKGFDVTMTTYMDGEAMEFTAKFDLSGETPKMYMVTETMGMNIETTLVDGTMYMLMTMSGMTIKQKTTDPEMIDEMMSDMDSVNESYDYASAEFISREDGLYVIKGVLTEAAAKDSLGDLDGLEVADVKASVTYECDKDGKVSKTTLAYSYTLAGETVEETVDMVFNSLEIPTITAPEDADEYTEMAE